MKPRILTHNWILPVFFLILLSSSAFAQLEDSHIEWKFSVAQDEVKQGSFVLIKGSATIDFGWHLYSVLKQEAQLELEFIELDGLETASKLYSPKGEKKVDTTFDEPYVTYDIYDKADIGIWLKVPENFNKSEAKVKFKLSWQVCENMCVPGEETFELSVKISANGQFIDKMTFPKNIGFAGDEYEPESENNIVNDKEEEPKENTAEKDSKTPDKSDEIPAKSDEKTEGAEKIEEKDDLQSLIGFLILAAIGGLGSILTPCVFPMIPVTVSYFLKTSEKKDTKPLLLSITYMIGIIFTLTFFGLILALILGSEDIGNRIAGMPWLNIIFSIILILFTLSFFGLFELTLPSGIINGLNKIGRNPQTGVVLSTFVLGVVFTLTSFACTGPIMGSIVLLAMKSGDFMRPFLGMLVYSVFFALPFLFLSLSPGFIKKLPKSGIWMVKIKVYMGFLIFLFAWVFIVNVDAAWGWGIFTRPVVLAIWAATFFMMGLYALGKFRFKEEGAATESGIGPWSGIFAIFLFSLAVYFGGSSLTGRPVWNNINTMFPPANYGDDYEGKDYYQDKLIDEWFEQAELKGFSMGQSEMKLNIAPQGEHDGWFYDYSKGLKAAKESGFPVFLNLTQHACKNCKDNESKIFPQKEIELKLRQFVLIKLYNDVRYQTTAEEVEINEKIAKKFEGLGVYPTYVVVNPETEMPVDGKASKIQGLLTVEKFSKFLDEHIGS